MTPLLLTQPPTLSHDNCMLLTQPHCVKSFRYLCLNFKPFRISPETKSCTRIARSGLCLLPARISCPLDFYVSWPSQSSALKLESPDSAHSLLLSADLQKSYRYPFCHCLDRLPHFPQRCLLDKTRLVWIGQALRCLTTKALFLMCIQNTVEPFSSKQLAKRFRAGVDSILHDFGMPTKHYGRRSRYVRVSINAWAAFNATSS